MKLLTIFCVHAFYIFWRVRYISFTFFVRVSLFCLRLHYTNFLWSSRRQHHYGVHHATTVAEPRH